MRTMTTKKPMRLAPGGLLAAVGGAVFAVAVMLTGGAAAQAEGLPFGQPKVAYSGVTVTEIAGQTMETRVYYTPGHQRNEVETAVGPQVMLLDFEKRVSYMLLPLGKSYMEMPMGAHGMGGTEAREDPEGSVEHEVVGRETIDGQETTKYRFKVTTAEGSSQGYVWLTDDGILMRQEAETTTGPNDQSPGRVVITLRDLERGPQDPALFELPADYQKIPTP